MFAVGKRVTSRLPWEEGLVGTLHTKDPVGRLTVAEEYKPHWGVMWANGHGGQVWQDSLELCSPQEIKEEDYL